MHFQTPPHDHSKLIFLTKGKIVDLILDIRMSSVTYSKYLAIDLIQNKNALIIPTGIAHGFVSLKIIPQ